MIIIIAPVRYIKKALDLGKASKEVKLLLNN